MNEPKTPWRTRKPSRDPSTPLGQWLKRGLDKAGISQYRLAQLMDRSESFVQKIYDGRTKQPRRENLTDLAHLLSSQWTQEPEERQRYLQEGLRAAYWTDSESPEIEPTVLSSPPQDPNPDPNPEPRRHRRRRTRLRYHGPEVTVNGPEDVVIGSGLTRFLIQGRYRSITIRGMASVEEVRVHKYPATRKGRTKRSRAGESKPKGENPEPRASPNGSAGHVLYPNPATASG